jgi:hypothetical protein
MNPKKKNTPAIIPTIIAHKKLDASENIREFSNTTASNSDKNVSTAAIGSMEKSFSFSDIAKLMVNAVK